MRLRSEWLAQQNGAKAYAGVRFLPRPDKFYVIEIVSDPRGVDTVTERDDHHRAGRRHHDDALDAAR